MLLELAPADCDYGYEDEKVHNVIVLRVPQHLADETDEEYEGDCEILGLHKNVHLLQVAGCEEQSVARLKGLQQEEDDDLVEGESARAVRCHASHEDSLNR